MPVRILFELGTDDAHSWSACPYRSPDGPALSNVIDPNHARWDLAWVSWLDDEQQCLAIGDTRLHWHGMSVPIDPDPFCAVAQLVAALDAVRPHGSDSRPGAP